MTQPDDKNQTTPVLAIYTFNNLYELLTKNSNEGFMITFY